MVTRTPHRRRRKQYQTRVTHHHLRELREPEQIAVIEQTGSHFASTMPQPHRPDWLGPSTRGSSGNLQSLWHLTVVGADPHRNRSGDGTYSSRHSGRSDPDDQRRKANHALMETAPRSRLPRHRVPSSSARWSPDHARSCQARPNAWSSPTPSPRWSGPYRRAPAEATRGDARRRQVACHLVQPPHRVAVRPDANGATPASASYRPRPDSRDRGARPQLAGPTRCPSR